MMPLYTLKQSQDWYNSLPGKRVSSAMLICNGRTALMVKANYRDYWTFPGGIVDPRESPKVAAIRETSEEVGMLYNDDEVDYLSVAYIPEIHGFNDRLHFFYKAPEYDGRQIVLQDNEIEAYEWVAFEEIGARADSRSSYANIQEMVKIGVYNPYFEA